MSNENDYLVKGLGLGTMQFVLPFKLEDKSGNCMFSVDSGEDSITAHAGGTQAAAMAVDGSKMVHRVTVVGTDADSVLLPASLGKGAMHVVINDDAAQSIQLFGAGTDTIDGITTTVGVAIAAGKRRILFDYALGKWVSILGA